MAQESLVARWWEARDKPGWRSFGVAMLALGVALLFALHSASAAERGRLWPASISALLALALAGWVAVKIVPVLARRTPLRWLVFSVRYRFTKEGLAYVGGVLLIGLAALNTGNNLLFIVLASLIAGIIVSGIVSSITISGLELAMHLPEHIFAEQPVVASLELRNEKLTLPSFSLRVVGDAKKARAQILSRPVYFPYLPRQRTLKQNVELLFPRRGVYRQDVLHLATKFPFGFLEKSRKVDSGMEAAVYPRVMPTEEFYEILPLVSGEIESFYRGRGHDLYAIRDYLPHDSARFVDWKASAKASSLKVREFTREDERRVLLVLDPFLHGPTGTGASAAALAEKFERGVTLCACLAWHFYEIDAELQYRSDCTATPMASAGEIIYEVLRDLALVEARPAPGDSSQASRFLMQLGEQSDVFKIILTSHPRGAIPTSLWTSSYFVFMDSL
jgi:uncharacterized protein (DUF58 family)